MTDGDGGTAEQEVRLVVQEAPDSWFWQLLNLLGTVFMWAGAGLLFIIVGVGLWGILFGRAAKTIHDPGRPGLVRRRRY